MVDVIVVFASSKILTTSYLTSFDLMDWGLHGYHDMHGMLNSVRKMNWAANGIGPVTVVHPEESVNVWRRELESFISSYEDAYENGVFLGNNLNALPVRSTC